MPTQWGYELFSVHLNICERCWTQFWKQSMFFFLHNHLGWRWLEKLRYSFHHGLCGENVRKPNLKPEMHCSHVSHCCLPVLVGWRAAKLELRTILSRVCSAVPWHFTRVAPKKPRPFSTWKRQAMSGWKPFDLCRMWRSIQDEMSRQEDLPEKDRQTALK